MTYQDWNTQIQGMDQFSKEELPTNIPGLYYSYHIMVGLGTIFIGLMTLAAFLLWRKKLFENKAILWAIMAIVPLPYIANLTGWYTAELGRQPYLVYNYIKTIDGVSPTVSSGNTLFTLLGFIGLYIILGLLFLLLVGKTIHEGPIAKQH